MHTKPTFLASGKCVCIAYVFFIVSVCIQNKSILTYTDCVFLSCTMLFYTPISYLLAFSLVPRCMSCVWAVTWVQKGKRESQNGTASG